MLAYVVAVSALFVSGFIWVSSPTRNPGNSYAFACDPFGYLRQAQLFQQRGLIGGLDTSIQRPDAQFLIDLAKKMRLPEESWGYGVAPHCHHYDGGSDRIIDQYPPGTGFFLSLFPYGTSGQHSYTVTVGLVAMMALGACLLFRPGPLGIAASTGAVAAVVAMLWVPMSFASYSIPWSAALAAIAALLAHCMFGASNARKVGIGLALGLVAGALVQVRIPNIFLVAGLAVFLFLEGELWAVRNWRRHGATIAVSSLLFLLVGPGLVAVANHINTGSALRTTYAVQDKTGIELLWDVIAPNTVYYFWKSDDWAFVDASILVLVVACGMAFRKNRRHLRNATIASLLLMALSVAFFLTHRVTAPYYLVPAGVLTMFLLVFAWQRESVSRITIPLRAVAAILFVFAGVIALRMHASSATPYKMAAPPEILQPDAVVWSEIMSGSLLMYNDKFAAKLPYVQYCTRFDFVRAIQESGRIQYFVVDSDLMRGNVEELAAETEQVGVYDAQEPFPVLRLVTMKPKPARCP